jgi:hypothetical protein
MSQQTFVKSEPASFQDDQEDLLMSYLNSDYMSTSSAPTCWNTTNNNHVAPPTPSPTPTLVQSPVSTPNIRQNFFDIVSPTSSSWSHLPDSPRGDEYIQQPIIHEFPFLISNHIQQPILSYNGDVIYHQPTPTPHFFSQQQQQQQQQQPASPPTSSCSSDGEQPKKRRGRKKRESCASGITTPSPLTPAIIAPAAPVVKQLATILPATTTAASANHQQQRQRDEKGSAKITSCYGNANKHTATPANLVTPALANLKKEDQKMDTVAAALDSQKAATIAKRQERLIKNRAAALLSRKRKREHLTALEDQRNGLTNENNALKEKVMQLEKEKLELRNKLDLQQSCDNKSAMIFMVRMASMHFN